MKRTVTWVVGLVALGLTFVGTAHAIPSRYANDVFWARQCPAGTVITLDGVLDEPAWASAETKTIYYAKNNADPGSGWQEEGGHLARDSTKAVLKFLVVGNQLYMGLTVPDSSVGGGTDFNKFDGLLMSIKNHLAQGFPKPPGEILYSWWQDSCDVNASSPGEPPTARGAFHGNVGEDGRLTYCDPRSAAAKAAWDAACKVHGLSNSDAVPDTGYTMELRFNLDSLGYNVTQAQGDVIEFNISVYDCDWNWPINLTRFASNRAWWESPWGRDMWYDQVQVWSKPSVTLTSGSLPSVPEDMDLHTVGAAPVITFDGRLNEAVWSQCDSLRITYSDPSVNGATADALRASYPSVMKYRSGQYQAPLGSNGGTNTVFDPGDMTVHWFFYGDSLYLGFDVRDQCVQSVNLTDRWDGVVTTLVDRGIRGNDRNLKARNLTFHIGPGGTGVAEDYLLTMRDSLAAAKFALALKPNTTVDTTCSDTDEGYTAEMRIDLTKLGYPHGLGDGILWAGFTLYDGDSFIPPTLNYATRTWFAREGQALSGTDNCCPAYVYMNASPTAVPIAGGGAGGLFAIHGNAPNPFRSSTIIQYALDRPAELTLEVYDLNGRKVATRSLGLRTEPIGHYAFSGNLKPGLYLYRLKAFDRALRSTRTSSAGKMMVLR